MPQVRSLLPAALKNHEIRRACTAVEHVIRAADILDQMSPAALEQIRDYCTDYIKGRRDTFSEFKHAYLNMVVEHLETARQMERKFYGGITGENWPEDEVQEQPQQSPARRL
jgi:hypothetical protein